jgi:hypothetical protein
MSESFKIELISAAVKTLEGMGYTWTKGAEQWKPPLGKTPDFDPLDSVRVKNDALAQGCAETRALFLDAAEQCCKAKREREALAQQLADSQNRLDTEIESRKQLATNYEATITCLEAMVAKGIDLDNQRRQEIEASQARESAIRTEFETFKADRLKAAEEILEASAAHSKKVDALHDLLNERDQLNHLEENKIKRTYQRHSYQLEIVEAWRGLGKHLEALASGEKAASMQQSTAEELGQRPIAFEIDSTMS